MAGDFAARPAASSVTAPASSTRRDHPGHEADPLALGGVDPSTGHHQLEGLLGRHRADERHGDHVGPEPTSISGVPNWASSLATTRSHASARPKPPPRAYPCTWAMTGLPSAQRSRNRPGSSPRALVQLEVAGAGGHARQVGAGAERLRPAPLSTRTRTSGRAAPRRPAGGARRAPPRRARSPLRTVDDEAADAVVVPFYRTSLPRTSSTARTVVSARVPLATNGCV